MLAPNSQLVRTMSRMKLEAGAGPGVRLVRRSAISLVGNWRMYVAAVLDLHDSSSDGLWVRSTIATSPLGAFLCPAEYEQRYTLAAARSAA
jgi:hypothetical protein